MKSGESKFLIGGTVFMVGALAVVTLFTAGLFLNQHEALKPIYGFFHSSVTAAIAEKVLKYSAVLVLILLIRIKPEFISFIGVGFGFAEATIRLIENINISIKPFWAHIVFGLTMALFFYWASKSTKPVEKFVYYGFALIVPVVMHLFYNLVAIK